MFTLNDGRIQVLTSRANGEYSTTEVSGMIETCWFGDDGSSRVIGRSMIPSQETAGTYRKIADKHIRAWEN